MEADYEAMLKSIIQRNALRPVPADEIGEDTALVHDLALDSVAVVNLFADIEEEFDIEIDVSRIAAPVLDKFRYLREYVQERMGVRN